MDEEEKAGTKGTAQHGGREEQQVMAHTATTKKRGD